MKKSQVLKNKLIKYATKEIHKEIADIFNEMANTGEIPLEIKTGILTPLQKPGKKRGPVKNLRPIVLLSTIRKILAICLIKRCWLRLKDKIPQDQAAYQPGRSTTVHVFAVKQLAEKAIQSSNYKIYILMLDMSKAIDTVNRKLLLDQLDKILEPDQMFLLINETSLQIKVDKHLSEKIQTNTGITQGDCLSATLFIIYLASCLRVHKQK